MSLLTAELILQEIRELAMRLRQGEEAIAHVEGHTRASWRVLAAAVGPGGTVPQLARRLGLKRQSVQRIADHLVEGGWAHYEANPHHRRSPLVRLTDKGESSLSLLERAFSDWKQTLGEELELEELETTLYVLRSLRANLQA